VVVHDVDSSRFPFEALYAKASGSQGAYPGMTRRLAVPGVPVERLFARPPKAGRLNLLLVINPTRDLAGAAIEGDWVERLLTQMGDRIELKVLARDEATKDALLDAFPMTDMLHYCGHAFYRGKGDQNSGLLLADEERLTVADMRGVKGPRVAFVNGCQSGRVRDVTAEAVSFAEVFLRSGVEAFVGTFWTVDDHAAQVFSREVYAQLAIGATLDEAVSLGRKTLRTAKLADHANYLLYGDGRFRLLKEG
jgi:CHAT domain-containing protein